MIAAMSNTAPRTMYAHCIGDGVCKGVQAAVVPRVSGSSREIGPLLISPSDTELTRKMVVFRQDSGYYRVGFSNWNFSLAGVQVYRGVTARSLGDDTSLRNFAIALLLVVGVALYFTHYWNPVMYLLGAILSCTLTVFWGLRSPVSVSLETSRLVLGFTLLVSCLYQFIIQQFRTPPEQRQTGSNSPHNERR